MGVVDELGDTLTSEQRRLLCLALQHQQEYDEDYEPSSTTWFVDLPHLTLTGHHKGPRCPFATRIF